MGRRLILLSAGIGGLIALAVIAFALLGGTYSRFWSPVPVEWVVGRLWFVYSG